jgi:phage terminase large subunit
MGETRLMVHARCVHLIESLETYRYPADRPEALTPVKDGSDHAVDALRYLVANLDRAYETKYGRYA